MDDYLSARMIRWPLCLLDMDVPVDGADAFVITTAERARDLPLHPGARPCRRPRAWSRRTSRTNRRAFVITASTWSWPPCRAKGDFWIDDVDVYFPYDGFTPITLNWIENAGWCGPGEAASFIEQHWDQDEGRILIDGRIPVNSHGGALSEGATQGSGHSARGRAPAPGARR